MRSFLELLTCLVLSCPATQGEPQPDYSMLPKKSQPYAQLVVDNAKNPSRIMAQIEQESSWEPFALSPFDGKGLMQIIPTTGEWLSLTKCKHLGEYAPYNTGWNIKCGTIYQEYLESNNHFGSKCNNIRIANQEYNGGAWVIWELKTKNTNDLDIAKLACGFKLFNGRKRAKWACKENYEYPKHIDRRQPKYMSVGGQRCG